MLDISTDRGRRTLIIIAIVLFAVILVISIAAPFLRSSIAQNQTTEASQNVASAPTMPVLTQGTPVDPPRALADWTLTSFNEEPFKLSDLKGKVVLLFFGYTSCPDVCPTTLADLADVKKELGDKADELAVVFVSVDPQRDNPERLKRYVTGFNPDFIGVTGSDEELRAMGKEYGLYFERRNVTGTEAGYLVDHTAAIFLIDPEQNMRMIYGFNTAPSVIAKDVSGFAAQ
jgi:Uncharacterized protein SCO1/SenC/PrrC, involved in biogenesis of respiratory and photosynthetic systems